MAPRSTTDRRRRVDGARGRDGDLALGRRFDLDAATFSELRTPLYTNVDARPITAGDAARDALQRQVASPVRWEQSIEAMAAAGVRSFVEIGPGRVLSGLVKKIVKDASTLSIGTSDDVKRLAEASFV